MNSRLWDTRSISIFTVTVTAITLMLTAGLIFIMTQGWSPSWTRFNLLGFLFVGSMTLFEGIRLTLPKREESKISRSE